MERCALQCHTTVLRPAMKGPLLQIVVMCLPGAEVDALYADMEPMGGDSSQLTDSMLLPQPRAADMEGLHTLAAAKMQLLAAPGPEYVEGHLARDSPVAERWGGGEEEMSYGEDWGGGPAHFSPLPFSLHCPSPHTLPPYLPTLTKPSPLVRHFWQYPQHVYYMTVRLTFFARSPRYARLVPLAVPPHSISHFTTLTDKFWLTVQKISSTELTEHGVSHPP